MGCICSYGLPGSPLSGVRAKKPVLRIDQAVYQVWRSLNPTERYCTLLETWLLRGNPEIIGESGGLSSIYGGISHFMQFFRRIPERGLQVAGNRDADYLLSYAPGWYHLALLELFGFVTIKHAPPVEGKAWSIERIWRTPLGNALFASLFVELFGDSERILERDSEGEHVFGALQPLVKPYFTDWRHNLSIPKPVFQEGTHIFRVSFVNHPYIDDGPWTREVSVGTANLRNNTRDGKSESASRALWLREYQRLGENLDN
jgi:hypothetical protein